MSTAAARAPASLTPGSMAIHWEVEQFNTRYCHCLDNDELEAWPDFFTEDGTYVVTTYDGYRRGLPIGVTYYDSR
ncbi:MAG: nuclear transport factor 2 family protein, partial [Acidimicrobiales bacterium]